MDDVRLTATNPADSSIVPVACNDKGELLLEEPITGPPGEDGQDGAPGGQGPEGPQGPPGVQGPPGEDGKDGKDGKDGEDGKDGADGIQLPPDPYEGAFLGWLNGGLSWIGTPPIEVPEGVFGPILLSEQNGSVITVSGAIPNNVSSGVYVFQCNSLGNEVTQGKLVGNYAQLSTITNEGSNGGTKPGYSNKLNAFDGDEGSGVYAKSNTTAVFNFAACDFPEGSVRIKTGRSGGGGASGLTYNNGSAVPGFNGDPGWYDIPGRLNSLELTHIGGSYEIGLHAITINGALLIDKTYSLNMRVQSVAGNMLIGTPQPSMNFESGQFLKVPAQRVAPWVLYGNDPTSLIDHLRSNRD